MSTWSADVCSSKELTPRGAHEVAGVQAAHEVRSPLALQGSAASMKMPSMTDSVPDGHRIVPDEMQMRFSEVLETPNSANIPSPPPPPH